jgi:hypothetical protein
MRSILAFFTLFALSTGLAVADPLPPQLATAFANFGAAKTYHMTLNAHGQQMDLDVVSPGRQHMTMHGGKMDMEMIRIDSDTYMKMNGTWQKFSLPGMDALFSKYAKYREIATGHTTDVKIADLGMTAVGGDPMHEYAISSATSDATDVYVGADGLIHQMVINGKDGTATMVFSGYNSPITIVAPI